MSCILEWYVRHCTRVDKSVERLDLENLNSSISHVMRMRQSMETQLGMTGWITCHQLQNGSRSHYANVLEMGYPITTEHLCYKSNSVIYLYMVCNEKSKWN